MSNRLRAALINSAIVAVSVLVALFIVEVGYRVWTYGSPSNGWALRQIFANVDGYAHQLCVSEKKRKVDVTEPSAREKGIQSTKVTFCHYLDSYTFVSSVDREGRRLARPDPTVRKAGKKIWIFGDSWVFGWGVNDDQTFPWLLQQSLPNVEVTNFALNGGSSVNELIELRKAIASGEKPDIAILVTPSYFLERNVLDLNWLRQVSGTAEVSRAYIGIGNALKIDKVKLPQWNYQCSSECGSLIYPIEYEQAVALKILEEAWGLLQNSGARGIVARSLGGTNDPVTIGAKRIGFDIVDMAREHAGEPLTLDPFDSHPNAKVQRYFHDALLKELAPLLNAPRK